MKIICTTEETEGFNILDYSDPSQPIGKMVPIAQARAAPEMYTQLKRIQSWLFVDLLHPARPIDRESAAKVFHEINALLNSTIDKD